MCAWFEYKNVGEWCVQWKSGKRSLEGAGGVMEGERKEERGKWCN